MQVIKSDPSSPKSQIHEQIVLISQRAFFFTFQKEIHAKGTKKNQVSLELIMHISTIDGPLLLLLSILYQHKHNCYRPHMSYYD